MVVPVQVRAVQKDQQNYIRALGNAANGSLNRIY